MTPPWSLADAAGFTQPDEAAVVLLGHRRKGRHNVGHHDRLIDRGEFPHDGAVEGPVLEDRYRSNDEVVGLTAPNDARISVVRRSKHAVVVNEVPEVPEQVKERVDLWIVPPGLA